MMTLKLGKKDAALPRGLRFGDVFNMEALPTPPPVFGHELLIAPNGWGMLGNDQAGDCTLCDAAHQTMLWSIEGGVARAQFATAGVLADYSAISGYNGTEASDTGCDMQDVATYRKNIGVIDASGVRHKTQGFVSLKVGNLYQIAQAAYLLGAVSVGVQLPSSAESQFDAQHPWSVVPHDGSEGGHCITVVGKNSAGNFLLITWGRLHAATPQWLSAYMDEAHPSLSIEMLNAKGVSPEAYDVATLTKYLGEL